LLTEAAHREIFVAGSAAWPTVTVRLEDFAGHLIGLEVSAEAALAHAADLYLAFACAQGNVQALEIFQEAFLSRTAEYIVRFRRDRDFEQEVEQVVREKLLFNRPPKIESYAAAGALMAWTRMVVVRAALDLTRSDRRWQSLENRLAANLLSDDESPEISILKRRFLPIVETALRQAIQDLDQREQGLLRIYFVDGFSIDRIGAVYRIHRGTAARRIISLRNRLLDQVRRAVGLDTGLSPPEVDSIWRLLRDDIHISLSRALARKPTE
jgi:RNA polymerase sigma-70 factor (ECF subfamily)